MSAVCWMTPWPSMMLRGKFIALTFRKSPSISIVRVYRVEIIKTLVGYLIFVKVTVLCASGNTSGCTHALCGAFTDECRDRGHDAELIDLSALDIEDCNGCGVCRKKGKCILSDGSDVLFDKVENSDLVVLATPIRFNGPSSIMKRFIDRLNPYWLSDKPHPSKVCGILCALAVAGPLARLDTGVIAAEIAASERRVIDIAADYGYDNSSKFAAAFRKVIGMTPRGYRKNSNVRMEHLQAVR